MTLAQQRGRWWTRPLMAAITLGISVPGFWVGLMAIDMLWGDAAAYPSEVLPVIPEARTKGDFLAACLAACRKHGLKLGFYYSQAQDWNHPGGAAGAIPFSRGTAGRP